VLAHTGRATISTNLAVSGNTSVVGLLANNSLGTAGYILKTNGTNVYWDVAPTGGGGGAGLISYTSKALDSIKGTDTVLTNVTAVNAAAYLQVANANAKYATKLNPATSGLLAHTGRATVSTNLAVSGNTSFGGLVNINYTGSANASLVIQGTNTKGGTGYHDFMMVRNGGGGTNPNKWFRTNSTGGLEIVNSAYSAVPFLLTDGGNLSLSGSINPQAWIAGQVIKDTMLDNTQFTVNATTVATSTSDTDFITYSYTPVSSSSYLVIHMHVASYDALTGTGGGNDSYFSRIKVGGNEITYGRQATVTSNSFRTGTLFPLTGRYTNSDTTAKTITVGVRRDSADDSITIVNSSSALWLRITEIAR
jgi:hypothetical protein